MSDINTRVEAFFAEDGDWREELRALRAILAASPLIEDFKWRSPCYRVEEGNVATVWRLKDCCTLSFFKGVLLNDRDGVLTAPGKDSRSMRVVKFASVGAIAGMEATLKDLIRQAIELEKTGRKVEFRQDDLEIPVELAEKLDGDAALKAAFEALTPGRQRGYVLHFSRPKQSKTRVSRIEKCAPQILAGKGMHDR